MSPCASSLLNWLTEAGLAKYADVFERAAIDLDMIGELTEADFAEMGIPIGDRLRLRRHFKASLGKQFGDADRSLAPGAAETTAEHRQITVLFCDLVGWTALSTEFDSEDLSDALSECRAQWTAAIERYDGFVAFRLGDGMMAFFGHPNTYEDSAERAILAGLDIVKSINDLREAPGSEISQRLAVRVGIATGKVLLNKKTTAQTEEIDVFGFTPNFAARLQGAAKPNSVVVSETTASMAWQRFRFSARDGVTLRGIEGPLRIYEVLRKAGNSESPQHQFGEMRREIIGREHEIGLLNDRWTAATQGDGQVIILSGEAGIGKSAIADALLKQIKPDEAETVRLECRSYYSNSYLHPVTDFMNAQAQITDDDTPDQKLAKLYKFLNSKGVRDPQDQATIANTFFFDIGSDDNLAMSSERQKAQTLKCIVKVLLHAADSRPKVILFEDSHWADPTSLEMLQALAGEVLSRNVLLIITSRKDETRLIKSQPNVSSLRLSRLSRSQGAQVIRNWSPDRVLPDGLEAQILGKSDGNPFFLEELTKTVCANLASDTGQNQDKTPPETYVTIPATLYDSLLSRLDRSPEARKLVGCAAVIGREFSEILLSKISRVKRDDTRRILDVLIKAGLLSDDPDKTDGMFQFKHALVQDAIYEGLTRKARRELHARIAFVLENSSPEVVKKSPEILAQHFDLAKSKAKALHYWEAAGRLAMEHSATTEALTHIERALSIIDETPLDRAATRRKISLLTTYGAALTSVKGYTAPETVNAYKAAWKLSNAGEDKTCFHEILYGMWNSAQVGSDYDRAQDLADTCLDIARKQDDQVSQLVAHNLCGVTSTLRGDHRRARTHLSKSIEIYDPSRFQSLAIRTGEDPGVESLSYYALNKWYMGDPKGAREIAERSLGLAKEIAYKQSLMYSLAMRGVLLHFCSEYDELLTVSDEIIDQSTTHNYPFFVEWGSNLKGWALAKKGDHDDALDLLANNWHQGFSTMLHAKVHLHAGDRDAGLGLIDTVIAQQPWLAPEAQRVKGELLLLGADSDIDAAFRYFLDAYALAEEQGATSLMLRVALSMADNAQLRASDWTATPFLQRALAGVDLASGSSDLKRAEDHLGQLGGKSPDVA